MQSEKVLKPKKSLQQFAADDIFKVSLSFKKLLGFILHVNNLPADVYFFF